MTRDDLNPLLDQLRAEIDALPDGDADARDRLTKLATALGEKIDDEPALSDRLVEAVEHFEADHPKVTALLNRLSALLSGAGL